MFTLVLWLHWRLVTMRNVFVYVSGVMTVNFNIIRSHLTTLRGFAHCKPSGASPSGSRSALKTNRNKSHVACILNAELSRARRDRASWLGGVCFYGRFQTSCKFWLNFLIFFKYFIACPQFLTQFFDVFQIFCKMLNLFKIFHLPHSNH